MLEELSGGWTHSRLDAELVTRICKKLGKLTLRFSMNLITDVKIFIDVSVVVSYNVIVMKVLENGPVRWC